MVGGRRPLSPAASPKVRCASYCAASPDAATGVVTPGRRVRLPSAPTRNALIMWVPPSLAYRYLLFSVSAISVVCAPVECAACAKTSVSAPSLSTENAEIESLAAFAVNAYRPSCVTAAQHAAHCVGAPD